MPSPPDNLAQWANWIVSVAAGLAVIWGFFAKILPAYRRYRAWKSDVLHPMLSGMQAVQHLPTVVAAVARIPIIEAAQEDIRKEVKPNGSSSLRDAIDRTEGGVRVLRSQLDVLTGVVRLNADSDPNIARFECDSHGDNIWVSKSYQRMLNRSEHELLESRFWSVIPHEDRERCRDEFASCREDGRSYFMPHGLTHADGRVLNVETFADPILEANTGTAVRWVGYIRIVHAQAPIYSGGYSNG